MFPDIDTVTSLLCILEEWLESDDPTSVEWGIIDVKRAQEAMKNLEQDKWNEMGEDL